MKHGNDIQGLCSLYGATQLKTHRDNILEGLRGFSKTQWSKKLFPQSKIGKKKNEKDSLKIANRNQSNDGGHKGY